MSYHQVSEEEARQLLEFAPCVIMLSGPDGQGHNKQLNIESQFLTEAGESEHRLHSILVLRFKDKYGTKDLVEFYRCLELAIARYNEI